VNIRKHPNIYQQEKAPSKKILRIDKFVQEIREVRKNIKKVLRKINKMIKRKINKR